MFLNNLNSLNVAYMCQLNNLTPYIASKNNYCIIGLCEGEVYWNSGNKETLASVKPEKTSRDRGFFIKGLF